MCRHRYLLLAPPSGIRLLIFIPESSSALSSLSGFPWYSSLAELRRVPSCSVRQMFILAKICAAIACIIKGNAFYGTVEAEKHSHLFYVYLCQGSTLDHLPR